MCIPDLEANIRFSDDSIEQDAAILADLMLWEKPVDDLTKEHVGETAIKLEGDRDQVRRKETNMGNLITDAIVASVADFEHDELDTTIQLALMNSGGIRGSIPVGDVSISTRH